jgi:WD40 repeat protein
MKVWDAKDGTSVANIELDAAVRQLVNCEDGFSMAAIDVNGRVTVWNPAWRRKVLVVEAGSPLKMVRSDPTTTRLATVTDAGSAQLWSLRTGELLALLAHPQPVTGAAFSPDGRRLATYDAGGSIRLWQTCSGSTNSI